MSIGYAKTAKTKGNAKTKDRKQYEHDRWKSLTIFSQMTESLHLSIFYNVAKTRVRVQEFTV